MTKKDMIKASLTKKQFVEQVTEYCDLRPWWDVRISCERSARFFTSTNETPIRYIWFEYERERMLVSITTDCQGKRSLSYYVPLFSFTAEDIPLLFDQLNLG